MSVSVFDLGPDTVTLVKRVSATPGLGPNSTWDPVTGRWVGTEPDVDGRGIPIVTETRITKAGCSWSQHPAFEEVAGTQIAVIKAVGHLVVDPDTESLSARDAVEFGGRLFEMQGPGIRRDDLDGNPDHVRAEAIWADDVSIGEQVTIIPVGGRDLDGNYGATGTPVTVIARAVTAGNQARRFGVSGETVAADFTVVLDPDTDITDRHWIVVRGRQCRALVTAQTSQWAARNSLIVLAQSRAGA